MLNHSPRRNTRQKSLRTIQSRNSKIGTARMGKTWKDSPSTTQGVSTFKIILIYSVMGMLLDWILPYMIMWIKPELHKDDAGYYGTIGAIGITGFFLVISLVKGLILRNRTTQESSNSRKI